MVKTYSFLLIAIFCEVAGTMLLPVSQNFTKIIPTVCLTIFYLVSFYLMTFVMDKLPIAIVYATWSGLGVFTIALLGYFFFKQTVGIILVKFCETGNNIVPATSQNMAISRKEYVLTIIKYFIVN